MFLFAAKGFTSDVTVAVIGHWSRDQSSSTSHFNFTVHSNAINYGMVKRSASCNHLFPSIGELLSQLLLLLSFPGQMVVEFFPKFACGKFLRPLASDSDGCTECFYSLQVAIYIHQKFLEYIVVAIHKPHQPKIYLAVSIFKGPPPKMECMRYYHPKL